MPVKHALTPSTHLLEIALVRKQTLEKLAVSLLSLPLNTKIYMIL